MKSQIEEELQQKQKKRSSSKKNKFENEDHDISKKFDEMEEILLELKLKEKKEKEQKSESTYSKYKDIERQEKDDRTEKTQELRMPMYSLDGMAGGRSSTNIANLIKSPIVKGINGKNI